MKSIVEGTLGAFGEKYAKCVFGNKQCDLLLTLMLMLMLRSYSSAVLSKIADDARKEGDDSDYQLLKRIGVRSAWPMRLVAL
jgi:hypothetical protein